MILLVEDNPDDEELTLRALKKHAIPSEVVVARSGEDALDFLFATGSYAGRRNALPHVTLLDLNLPRMNGFDVLQRLRSDARTKYLPVVVLSSSREDEDVLRSYRLGANAYVRKPVDFVQFTETVRVLGDFWLVINQAAPS